ncbi:hypothetical protein TeGR_g6082 [Tetraparma gracilis]|uniref:BTB domain-containing protein n=1 Tax=Tetraparma gracilis TaxID=2962635 RepID=A0ABQ6NAU7_9STRA|nr:hypothetical protein TeGR_g6082 [Tetraparma gracilis]
MDHEREAVIDDVLGGIQQRLSLEATVLEQRAAELKTEAYKLARQRAFLREERRKAREDALAISQDKEEFEMMKRDDWFPGEYLKGGAPSFRKVKINVGGQLFELSEVLLNREPGSLLAALLEDDSPLADGEEGVVHVDRDWWTFRHILKFLRDGVLPRDKELLTLLYKEASFWRMRHLKQAIEEERLNLSRRIIKWDEEEGELVEEDVKVDKWYKELPNWWESAEKREKRRSKERKREKKDKKKGKKVLVSRGDDEDDDGGKGSGDDSDKDWWTGAEYNGKKYSTLSSDRRKVIASDDEDEDAIPMLSTTWSSKGGGYRSSGFGGGGRSTLSNSVDGLFGNYGDYCYPGVSH